MTYTRKAEGLRQQSEELAEFIAQDIEDEEGCVLRDSQVEKWSNKIATALAEAAKTARLEECGYKDAAYSERNKLVRLLASLYPSGIKQTAIDGWDEAWHWCVYIDMPNGQASWHFHIDDLPMFADLPAYAGEWDGHSTEQKYANILALASYPQHHQQKTKAN